MPIKTYLYNSDGGDEVEFTEGICRQLDENQLLWVSVSERDKSVVENVIKILKFKNAPVKDILDTEERPKLDKFEHYFRIFINSVLITEKGRLKRVPIDFLIAQNVVITIQTDEIDYFEEFRNLEKGERHIGEMDAESFLATLLDLHVVSYYRAVEHIEREVDKFDETILTSELKDKDFFSKMISLRRDASKLRRWLMPHRDVFYALSRPDFNQISESDSAGHFRNLNQRFEGSIDAIENLRDTVLSLFDLYATRSSHRMNDLMKRLTFATIIFGAMSVIVGALGMNFDVGFFKAGDGFWLTLVSMGFLALILIVVAKIKDWI
ncbi:MAG: CorA family divalent cation transporter [Pyrinomonadaceae bacterium]